MFIHAWDFKESTIELLQCIWIPPYKIPPKKLAESSPQTNKSNSDTKNFEMNKFIRIMFINFSILYNGAVIVLNWCTLDLTGLTTNSIEPEMDTMHFLIHVEFEQFHSLTGSYMIDPWGPTVACSSYYFWEQSTFILLMEEIPNSHPTRMNPCK